MLWQRWATSNSSILRRWRQRTSCHVSSQSPVIVGGCQRSGTTLLRVMLDSHPAIACGIESSLLCGSFLPALLAKRFGVGEEEVWRIWQESADHALFIERFLTRFAAAQDKARWAEKTPQNVRHLAYIFEHFPQAKFIHIVRDARDVVCSIRTHPAYQWVDGKSVPTGLRRPLKPCIDCWLHDTADGMQWRNDPRYLEVKYEQLVKDTESELRRVCDFLGEPWSPAMLEYYRQENPSRTMSPVHLKTREPIRQDGMQRWKKDLSASELVLVEKRTSQRMKELGYEVAAAG